jgi:hypothetical protein
MLVEAIAVGVCGTDTEIVEGKYGWAPPGKQRLVLGHESLGRVQDPGSSSAFHKGELVVSIVSANKRLWYTAGQVLAQADRNWLAELVTRCETPENFAQALQRSADDIKVVVQFAEA